MEGAELERLEEDEGVVRSSDYLQARFPEDVWRVFRNKFNNLFRRRLKEAKVADAEKTKRRVYTFRNQGGIRIVYTRNDIVLMDEVFQQCEDNFKRIAKRDMGRQGLITDYAPPSIEEAARLSETFALVDTMRCWGGARPIRQGRQEAEGDAVAGRLGGAGLAAAPRPPRRRYAAAEEMQTRPPRRGHRAKR